MKHLNLFSLVLSSICSVAACAGGDSGGASGDGDGMGGSGDGDGDTAGDGDGDTAGDGDGDTTGDGDGDTAGDGDGDTTGDGDGDTVGDGDGDTAGDGDGDGMGGDGTGGDGTGGDGDLSGDGDGDAPDLSFPTCTILAPTMSQELPFAGFNAPAFTLEATAEDAEDGQLSGSSVVWRANDVPLGSGLEVEVQELAPGSYEITCTVTDSDENAASTSVFVDVVSPVAVVNHPGAADGPRQVGSDFPFSGFAKDYEDGDLDPDTYEWSSDLDGALGNPIDSTSLSMGTHVVTMTAKDSEENAASATVVVVLE